MSDNKKPLQDSGPPPSPGDTTPGKKPYTPPKVVAHNALEVITGACSPAPPGKVDAATCTLVAS